jgi:hypothetical protein
MPPRIITLAVVLFWLATTGFFLRHQIRPLLIRGEPPPFAIDLLDEATERKNLWDVLRNDKRVGKAETWIQYRKDDDQFELYSRFLLNDLALSLAELRVNNVYRVTRDGELREVLTKVWIMPPLAGLKIDAEEPDDAMAYVAGKVLGPVRDGNLEPSGSVTIFGDRRDLHFDPVPMTGRGSVLNPLHPVHRLRGLRPGREWNVPLFDPVALLSGVRIDGKDKGGNDAMFHFVSQFLRDQGGPKVRSLHAEVLSASRTLSWGTTEIECLVIEYRSGEMAARTWVRERDGLVLQQEASFQGDRMTLKRTTPHVP